MSDRNTKWTGDLPLAQAVWLHLFDPTLTLQAVSNYTKIPARTVRRYARIARSLDLTKKRTGVIWTWSQGTIPPWPKASDTAHVAKQIGQGSIEPTIFAQRFRNGGAVPPEFKHMIATPNTAPMSGRCRKLGANVVCPAVQSKPARRPARKPAKRRVASHGPGPSQSDGPPDPKRTVVPQSNRVRFTIGRTGTLVPPDCVAPPSTARREEYDLVRDFGDVPVHTIAIPHTGWVPSPRVYAPPPLYTAGVDEWAISEVEYADLYLPVLVTEDGTEVLACGGGIQDICQDLALSDIELCSDLLDV